jgi:hypothetical protein
MSEYKKLLVLSMMLLLIVAGASAAKFVINDGDASLSLAATPDHEVAFSIVAADNPNSYSASMSASDSSGAAATQESSVGGADHIFSASAGISPDGDYAYTFTETAGGSSTTTQSAQASQGNSASAAQNTFSIAAAGASTSNATDSDGNTASQSVAFLLGINDVHLAGTTSTVPTASQNGIFAGIAANTLGLARGTGGNSSYTKAYVAAGGMTFDNIAMADSKTTSASQGLFMASGLGSAEAGSEDAKGNVAFQSASFIGGILTADQSANTDSNEAASQSGTFAGLSANTLGFAKSGDGDNSTTCAGVFTGAMTFDNSAKAEDTNTTASQNVMIAGLLGSAHAGSIDQDGNHATQDTAFAAGVLNTDQTADTLSSANAVQSGDFAGLGAMTNGFAISTEGDISHTYAGVFTGGMAFDNTATAEDTNTTASQDVMLAGLFGSAHAGSLDQDGNIATQDALFAAGVLNTDQSTDTLNSANALQTGDFIGLGAMTKGFALASNGDVSHSSAGVFAGEMTFNDEATAQDTFTSSGQNVQMAALAGIASVGSNDGTNETKEGSAIILGSLDVTQEATTTGSAHAFQSGTMNAALGSTWGEATSGAQKSWTKSDVVVGTMIFDNNATADGHTTAGQALSMTALAGNASAGSNDGMGNATSVGSGILIGTQDVTQDANTSASAHATQNGTMSTALGNTWGEATSGAQQSWTKADVVVGTMSFDNNATADGHTTTGQTLNMAALAGNASAGSNDGMGNATSVGSGILIGTQDVTQNANTSGSAHAVQSGTMSGALGYTWGEATNGNENSWTKADIVVGTMTFDNFATADTDTYDHTLVGQVVQMGGDDGIPVAGAGGAEAGSTDGTGTAKVASDFILGTMDASQGAFSSHVDAGQNGTMSAALGNTSGEATLGAAKSWTKAGVIAGTMTYDNSVSSDPSPFVNQKIEITGIDGIPVAGGGSAEVGATDGTNTTRVGSEFILSTFDTHQHADASASAHANQIGNMSAAFGTIRGNATNGAQQSWTNADIVVGNMSFRNSAIANGSTSVDQMVNMATLFGNASAGSDDGVGNVTEEGAGVILGTLNVSQQANTSASAHSTQTGDLLAGYGYTWGNAANRNNNSWTNANVLIGAMNFTAGTNAGGITSADQRVQVPFAIAGNITAGSTDGTNKADVGADYIVGIFVDMDQQADTSSSARATQSGVVPAAVGGTSALATSGSESSWSNSTVFVGLINVGENTAIANGDTKAFQSLNVTGLSGNATAGSTDGINTTEVGAELIGGNFTALGDINWTELLGGISITNPDDLLPVVAQIVGQIGGGGYLDVDQQADTSGSALANQTGNVFALGNAHTWAEATSGSNESWTSANVTTGLLTMTNNTVVASGSTSARQQLNILGVLLPFSGNASVGSTDGSNSVAIGGQITSNNVGASNFNMDLNTNTGGSAYASQSGSIIVINGNGGIWGTANSGTNSSWSSANVTSTSLISSSVLTVTSNNVSVGTTPDARQKLSSTGFSSDTWIGSSNGTNYAVVGLGYTHGTTLTGSITALNQQTNTTTSPIATQNGNVASAGSTLGDIWVLTISGDTSNSRLAYVNSTGRLGLFSVSNSTAYSSTANVTAYEKWSNANVGRSTTAFAENAGGSSITTSTSNSHTTASAWATTTNTYANV